MHQNRNSLTPLRMYRVVHDAALHIHEEINDHPHVQEYLASFQHAWTLPLRNTSMRLLTLNPEPGSA